MDLKKLIRDIPDFPIPGILFHDVTTLFNNPVAFKYIIDHLTEKYQSISIKHIAGIEARGFILGSALAYNLNCGFIPVRKPGKLPFSTITEEYQLEYGTGKIEIHTDACNPGDKILLVDDLVATGGTLLAAIRLFQKLNAEISGVAAVIDMPELGGRSKLKEFDYYFMVEYLGH